MIPELKLLPHPETGILVSEEWRDIVGTFGIFQISNYGRVKSIFRYTKNGQGLRPVKERIRSINYQPNPGYWEITLKNVENYFHFRVYIHRLVADHFIPNPENKAYVNHIDGDKLNPFVFNLEWSTPTENQQHAYNTGLKVGYWKGKVIHNAKKVLAIQDMAILEFPSASHCANYFDVCQNTILRRIDKLIPIKNHLIYSL